MKSVGENKQLEENARRSKNKTAHELLVQSLENQELILQEIREQRKEQQAEFIVLNKTCSRKCVPISVGKHFTVYDEGVLT